MYLDIGLCQQNKQNRSLGENAFCSEPEKLGRIVVGNAISNLSCKKENELYIRPDRENHVESATMRRPATKNLKALTIPHESQFHIKRVESDCRSVWKFGTSNSPELSRAHKVRQLRQHAVQQGAHHFIGHPMLSPHKFISPSLAGLDRLRMHRNYAVSIQFIAPQAGCLMIYLRSQMPCEV